MNDKLIHLDKKIALLKKRREKLRLHQALLFTKEAQKIMKENFSTDIALTALNEAWTQASDQQKREWATSPTPFRSTALSPRQQESSPGPTALEN